MGFLSEFITTYGNELLYMILTAILSFIGLKMKSSYDKHINEKTKKMVVEDTVKYVEQIYKNAGSKKKYELAKENILDLLNDKGIQITDLEIKVLIESACNNFTKTNEQKTTKKKAVKSV